jgi:hypothetical protein
MNKLKQPVIFEIEGTGFEVDIDQQVLRQTNDQANEISFINDMQDQGAFYMLLYDLDKKTPCTTCSIRTGLSKSLCPK